MMSQSKKCPSSIRHYFVDEAGDSTLFDRRGRIIVGSEGCSHFFILGLVDIAEPENLADQLEELSKLLDKGPDEELEVVAQADDLAPLAEEIPQEEAVSTEPPAAESAEGAPPPVEPSRVSAHPPAPPQTSEAGQVEGITAPQNTETPTEVIRDIQ